MDALGAADARRGIPPCPPSPTSKPRGRSRSVVAEGTLQSAASVFGGATTTTSNSAAVGRSGSVLDGHRYTRPVQQAAPSSYATLSRSAGPSSAPAREDGTRSASSSSGWGAGSLSSSLRLRRTRSQSSNGQSGGASGLASGLRSRAASLGRSASAAVLDDEPKTRVVFCDCVLEGYDKEAGVFAERASRKTACVLY